MIRRQMTELQQMAKNYIICQTDPDLVGIQEFFDYDISNEDAIKVYELILEAKVEVSWD